MEKVINAGLHFIPGLATYFLGEQVRAKALFEYNTIMQKKHPKIINLLSKKQSEEIEFSTADQKIVDKLNRDIILIGYGIPISIALLGLAGVLIGVNSDNSYLMTNSAIIALTHLTEVFFNFSEAVKSRVSR